MSAGQRPAQDGEVVDTFRRPLFVAAALLAGLGGLAAALEAPGGTERVVVATTDDRDAHRTRPRVLATTSTTSAPASSTTSAPSRRRPAATTTPTTAAHQPVPVPATTSPPREQPDDPDGPDVVRGRVSDETDAPVPGMCIMNALPPSANADLLLARTGADGRYRIERPFDFAIVRTCDGVRPEFGFAIEPPGFRRGELSPGTVTHDIRVRRQGGVRGRVVDQSGNPVAGVLVAMCCAEFPGHEPTGADGRFAIRNITPGPQPPWLHYRGPGPAQTPQEGAVIDVVGGQWNEVIIVLGPWTPWYGGY